ncbi:MAG: hypothetical protein QXF26_09760 [Candidatus Bathyarchaeia archaeon]
MDGLSAANIYEYARKYLTDEELIVLQEELKTASRKRRAYTSNGGSPIENYELAANMVSVGDPAIVMLARIAEKVRRVALWFYDQKGEAPLDDLVDISIISRLIASRLIKETCTTEDDHVRS